MPSAPPGVLGCPLEAPDVSLPLLCSSPLRRAAAAAAGRGVGVGGGGEGRGGRVGVGRPRAGGGGGRVRGRPAASARWSASATWTETYIVTAAVLRGWGGGWRGFRVGRGLSRR